MVTPTGKKRTGSKSVEGRLFQVVVSYSHSTWYMPVSQPERLIMQISALSISSEVSVACQTSIIDVTSTGRCSNRGEAFEILL